MSLLKKKRDKSSQSALKRALLLALSSSRQISGKRSSTNGPRLYELNTADATKTFKTLWLYAQEASFERSPLEACGSHYFIFYKNLGVTNISLAEISSLLRKHTKRRFQQKAAGILLHSDELYGSFLNNLFASLAPPPQPLVQFGKTVRRMAQSIVENYCDVLSDTVVLDVFFTGAVVHIPVSLEANIQRITLESGYIHSVGHALFVRNASKASPREINTALKDYLKYAPPKTAVYLTPYADEYFSPHEENTRTSLRNGLDGIRIQLRKQYVGDQLFRDYLNTISRDFKRKIHVAEGWKSYLDEKSEKIKEQKVDPDVSIIIFADTKFEVLDYSQVVRGHTPYVIVYAQYLRNNNQFILFKERKPAWVGPVTLPHTLSIAMVNIARCNLSAGSPGKPRVFLDPFCGSGTTLIDAYVRSDRDMIIGFDRQRVMPQLIRDNVDFFSWDKDKLNRSLQRLRGLIKNIDKDNGGIAEMLGAVGRRAWTEVAIRKFPQIDPSIFAALRRVLKTVRAVASDPGDWLESGTKALVDGDRMGDLKAMFPSDAPDLECRLLHHLIWRALVNGTYSLARDPNKLKDVVREEFANFSLELEEFCRTLEYRNRFSADGFEICDGVFSQESMVSIQKMRRMKALIYADESSRQIVARAQKAPTPGIWLSVVNDSTAVLASMRGSVDVIVTDPPYGFNTGEYSPFELQDLYGRFIRASVLALKSGGQLMLAVPSSARNGRQIPYFQTRSTIARQVIAQASENKRQVVRIGGTSPTASDIYSPPFHWSSKSSLSRDILWFTIQ